MYFKFYAMNFLKRLSFFFLLFILCACSSNKTVLKSNPDIKVYDLGTKQLSLFNQNMNVEDRNQVLIDSIYEPYKVLWNGYLGDGEKLIDWVNSDVSENLNDWNRKSKTINSKKLTEELVRASSEMKKFTGFTPKGEWYIFYGPSWTNLGGFGNGVMLIDLAHPSNNSFERIVSLYPHELNHQIYAHTLEKKDNLVLDRILDEGFATYVSYVFHEKKKSVAEELSYSVHDYEFCRNNEHELIELLRENYAKKDEKIGRNFANRNFRFKEGYPGAVGYYIGFRIVEEFVKHNGKNSWKQIYIMPPLEVLEKSKILQK